MTTHSIPARYTASARDWVLFAAVAFFTVYGLVLLLATPKLLVDAPHLLAALTGSGLSMIAVGAESAATGASWWPWLLAGMIMPAVMMPIHYAVGRRWGWVAFERPEARYLEDEMHSRADSVRDHPWAWMIVSAVPFVKVNAGEVAATAGYEHVRWQRLAGIYLTLSLAYRATFLALGCWFSGPVSAALDYVSRHVLFVTVALVAVFILNSMRRSYLEIAGLAILGIWPHLTAPTDAPAGRGPRAVGVRRNRTVLLSGEAGSKATALTPEQARDLADELTRAADHAERVPDPVRPE